MAFSNMDIDTCKVLIDLCLEQVDRDVGDLLLREVQEENEDRVYANILEPYDDGHGRNTIETPMNDDHRSNSNDSIETSIESSVLPQVVVSVESYGSGLPQDNVQDHTGQRLEKQDIEVEASLEDEEDRRRAYSYFPELFSSLNNSAKKDSESEGDNDDGDDSAKRESKSNDGNNGEDGYNDSLRFEKLDIDQKQKYWLNIYQQLEGASMEADDIIQELQIIKVQSSMDIELLKEEILDPAQQRLENFSKLVHDFEKEVALEDRKNRRKAETYLQELISSFKNSAEEESITEESDKENDSVTDEMYYSCCSDAWDTMSDISDYESCSVDMNSESSSEIDGTIWDRVLAKSPDFCVDNY